MLILAKISFLFIVLLHIINMVTVIFIIYLITDNIIFVESLLTRCPDIEIVCEKTDNCSKQYKCLNVYPIFREFSIKYNITFIHYYGVRGHAKGLVDAMSGFGLKIPYRNAIVTDNIFCNSAEEIYTFISEKMKDEHNKIYEHLQMETKPPTEQFPINGSRKCLFYPIFHQEKFK